jgi:integrase/recombinase XerD
MRSLRDGAEDYLMLRRGLGFKLKRPARFVRSFVESLEKRGETRITTQLALEWATQPQHLQPAEWAARLSGVRAFARYWISIDAATEIPPEGLLPFRARRAKPYLYSELEVQRLLEEARRIGMGANGILPRVRQCCKSVSGCGNNTNSHGPLGLAPTGAL